MDKKMINTTKLKMSKLTTFAILLFLLFLAVIPYLAILSINTLFPTAGIVFSSKTWLAMLFLVLVFNNGASSKR
jgi:hypothetical protein